MATGLYSDVEWTTASSGILVRISSPITCVAQSYIAAHTLPITTIVLKAETINSPVGHVWVEFRADSAGSPNSVALSTSTIVNVGSLTNTYKEVSFSLTTPITVTLGTTYWIVVFGDYVIDGSKCLEFAAYNGAGGYSGGVVKQYDGASWSNCGAGSWVLYFKVQAGHAIVSTSTIRDLTALRMLTTKH